jgi:hypothetical protein
MWLPQDPQPGRVIGDLTRHVDVAPTLASLAGPTLDLGNTRVDGIDLSPALLAPGSGVGGAGESLSFADRYWALHSREQSAHHDNWHDTAVALDLSVDRWNYESGVAIESDGAAETLLTRLEQQRVQQKASWDSLPSRSDPADHAMLAFAGAVDSERDPPPTYSDSKLDHRWGQLGGYLLCHPSEQCGGLSTSFPWTPGRYHLSLRFDPSRVEGFRNEVTLAVLGTGLDPLRVKGNEESVYVGELDLGDPLSLRLSDPLGGVALTGIELTRVGAEDQALGDHGEPTMDPHQLEQLRALGYIN